jgi:hypothetical protein
VLHGVLVRAGNILIFLEFLQYEEFLAYLVMTNRVISAPKGRKEALMSEYLMDGF